jgi:hypothetical protein
VQEPLEAIAPDAGVGVIIVDLDLDCSSIWLRDPFVIRSMATSDAMVEGPTEVSATKADCATPFGIVEVVPEWTVRVPMSLPAYEFVAVTLTFMSDDHALDAGQTQSAEAFVEPLATPRFTVAGPDGPLTVTDEARLPFTFTNTGNVDLKLTFEATGLQGSWTLLPGTVARGEAKTVDATWTAPAQWTPHVTQFTFVAADPQGMQAPPMTVEIDLAPAAATESEGAPAPLAGAIALLIVAGAAARSRRL